MKFALCNEMLSPWSIDNQFEAISAWGYDGVELAPFSLDPDFSSGASKLASVDNISASIRNRIRSASAKTGVKVSGLHWILAKTEGYFVTTPDSNVRRNTSEYLKRLAELCADLGGTYMVLGSPQQRNIPRGASRADADKYALDMITAVVPTLEKLGVTLALEALAPTETNYWTNSEETLDFISELGEPSCVRLHLDCKAMDGGEYQAIPEVIERVWKTHRCVSFHANDPNLKGPGFGRLDFQPIMAALEKAGFDGWVGIEPFDYSPGIVETGRESLRYLKRFVRQA